MGYGHRINERIQCEAMQDMLKHLRTNDLPKSKIYFAHSATIKLLLNSLGFAKSDGNLRPNNFIEMQNRKYRTSYLVPFGANLVVVKYNCVRDAQKYKIKLFLNEKPLILDGFENGIINLLDINDKYKKFIIADCKKYFCSSSGYLANNGILMLLLLIILTNVIYFQNKY